MIISSSVKKEHCQVCNKNILFHNSFAICTSCSEIAHEKCAQKCFNFDQIHDSWHCGKCFASQIIRYNPFKNIFHDSHLPDDSEAMDEINIISQILNSCKNYDSNTIDNITSQLKTNFSF